MPAYFPLFVNLSGKKFVVFGAGKIAARRVGGLLRFGAVVTVIAPEIGIHMQELYVRQGSQGQLSCQKRRYCPGEIQKENADFVLAATNDRRANAKIYMECRKKEIPVNNASDCTQCDFYFPALVEREQLVIGVTSTEGNHKKTARFCERLRSLDDLAEGI
ncbi:MAG: bifunctional precorrin-2 dehydrogenase/sirohydrochlorin ferrochelatase [Eubacterium sp.]|nr:bifunctional precorrin-2 dehydrogenase/sirohydrochlorin ferrochelatase [Eubacterium sp.]